MTHLKQMMARIDAWSRPCIRLAVSDAETSSFIGGAPTVSLGAEWPSWKGRALCFLGQIDLAQASLGWWPEWMPRAGFLLFFYEAEEQTWGFDPADRGSWQVRYVANASETPPPPTPPRTDGPQFRRKNISFRRSNSRPSWERLVLPRDRIDYGTDEWKQLSGYLDDQLDRQLAGNPAHQLFGLPVPQQGDGMELECQLASNGLYVGNSKGYDDPRRTSLEVGAVDWHLLLQIDSDDSVGMMWGDVGMLYFWIRKQDAEAADFSNVWLVLQCG